MGRRGRIGGAAQRNPRPPFPPADRPSAPLSPSRLKYYDNCLFHKIVPGFIAQSGDPTGTGSGGACADAVLAGAASSRFFADEITPALKHDVKGRVGMVGAGGKDTNASQFYITLSPAAPTLDGRHTLFGTVAEGGDVLDRIGEVAVDGEGRPLQNLRIRRAVVLDDPFPDPPGLAAAVPGSPLPPPTTGLDRLEDGWAPPATADPGADPAAAADAAAAARAAAAAVVLEMVGDLPAADVAPPDTMLFVCKLNPVTREEDLDTIFSRFGAVTSCDIVRDARSGDSLGYGFIGFEAAAACEQVRGGGGRARRLAAAARGFRPESPCPHPTPTPILFPRPGLLQDGQRADRRPPHQGRLQPERVAPVVALLRARTRRRVGARRGRRRGRGRPHRPPGPALARSCRRARTGARRG